MGAERARAAATKAATASTGVVEYAVLSVWASESERRRLGGQRLRMDAEESGGSLSSQLQL